VCQDQIFSWSSSPQPYGAEISLWSIPYFQSAILIVRMVELKHSFDDDNNNASASVELQVAGRTRCRTKRQSMAKFPNKRSVSGRLDDARSVFLEQEQIHARSELPSPVCSCMAVDMTAVGKMRKFSKFDVHSHP
jgi:hypothetical protein